MIAAMRIALTIPIAALIAASLPLTLGAQGRVPPPLTGAVRGGGAPQPPLLQDYISFSVTAPPPELELDALYRKYANAQGIPIASSEKVPDAALLMARDIVTFMLSERPAAGTDSQEVEDRDHGADGGDVRHPRTPEVPPASEDRR